jgi:hypothetical protein
MTTMRTMMATTTAATDKSEVAGAKRDATIK